MINKKLEILVHGVRFWIYFGLIMLIVVLSIINFAKHEKPISYILPMATTQHLAFWPPDIVPDPIQPPDDPRSPDNPDDWS
jgi:hypothetical protein